MTSVDWYECMAKYMVIFKYDDEIRRVRQQVTEKVNQGYGRLPPELANYEAQENYLNNIAYLNSCHEINIYCQDRLSIQL